MCGRETFRMERIVKLFVRFRPLCLRYLQPTTTRLQMSKFWRCFQNTDSQPFEFYRHEFDAGNRPERAQTVLKKGHSCDTRKSQGFSCGLKSVFRSGWRFLADALLSILFTVIRVFRSRLSPIVVGACPRSVFASPSVIHRSAFKGTKKEHTGAPFAIVKIRNNRVNLITKWLPTRCRRRCNTPCGNPSVPLSKRCQRLS